MARLVVPSGFHKPRNSIALSCYRPIGKAAALLRASNGLVVRFEFNSGCQRA